MATLRGSYEGPVQFVFNHLFEFCLGIISEIVKVLELLNVCKSLGLCNKRCGYLLLCK